MAETDRPRRWLLPEVLLLALFVLLAAVAVAVTPELRDAILGSAPRAADDAGTPAAPPPE